MQWPEGQKVKGQGHTVTKTVTVARLLVTTARIPHTNMPLCYLRPLPPAGVGLHVDTIAYVV